jgi:hypothetical protein
LVPVLKYLQYCRERFGHFLNKLGAVYNCTESAVTGIVGEMSLLFNVFHSYICGQVSGNAEPVTAIVGNVITQCCGSKTFHYGSGSDFLMSSGSGSYL